MNVLSKIRENDLRRDRKEYMKRRNRQFDGPKASPLKMAIEENKEVSMKKRKHTLKHKTSKLLEKVESEYLPDKKLKRSDTKESLDEKKHPKKQEDKVDLMLKQEQAVNRIEAIKQ